MCIIYHKEIKVYIFYGEGNFHADFNKTRIDK